VLRFWEHEDPVEVVDVIEQAVRGSQRRSAPGVPGAG
jgi:hypothetical protein